MTAPAVATDDYYTLVTASYMNTSENQRRFSCCFEKEMHGERARSDEVREGDARREGKK
jgi:hypothetical protein